MSGKAPRQPENTASPPVTIIQPISGWVPVNFREIWEYRELLYFLIWRDVKIRYKQTVMGFTWAIIQPFMMMVAFTLFFGTLAKIPSEGIPYPIFSYAALLPWTLFSEGINRSASSMVSGASMVQKIYCPRLVLPISGVLSPIVDFGIALVILVAMMIWYGYWPTVNILMLPVFIILALLTSMGVGLWLSAINVRYRDVRYILPFLMQLWLFASPVVYSSGLLPARFEVFYGLNPMAGVIEGFRWCLLGTAPPSSMMLVSVAITIVFLVTGIYYFRRTEKSFADVI